MAYVLGIDIGTGSAKAVGVDLQGNAVEVAQQYYSFKSPKPGYHEQDPEQIWSAFLSCVEEVISKTGIQPTAISLSSAMHSLIPVDEIGRPLAPMITWADNRSTEIAKRLQTSTLGSSIYKTTGTPLHAMSPLCKLIWIKENDPQLFAKTFKFISIKEYIWYKLFQEFKIDYSIASCTGLFDIYELKWHPDSLNLAGITELKLSDPVVTNYSKIFKANLEDKELGFLVSDVAFVIGASDGCLSNLGSMANEAGVAVLTIGTSGAIRISSNRPLPNLKAMTFSYILDETTFVCGGPINNGGLALQWWLKNYASSDLEDQDYIQFFKDIDSINPGSEGLLFLPYLTGERAPVWDSESCGVFFGVKLQHNKHHFSRAVLEGICYAMKEVLEAVQESSDPITQINIGGGFVTSDLWVQMLADVTGKKLVIAQHEDASAVGAAYLAMKTLNMISHYPTSNQLDLNTITPDVENNKRYSKHFEIYRRLYSDLKDTMHLNYHLNEEVL
jgi:gluconokinase